MAEEKKRRRRRRSLPKGIRRLVLVVSLVIFIIATIMSYVFLNLEVDTMMAIDGNTSTAAIKVLVEETGGFEDYANKVLSIYRSIPEDIRANVDSPEYRAYFEGMMEDPFIKEISPLVLELTHTASFQDFYLAMYDVGTSAIVYLLDFSENMSSYVCPIGEWESVEKEEIDTFLGELPAGELRFFASSSERYGSVLTCGTQIEGPDGEVAGLAMSDVSRLILGALTGIFTAIYFVVLAILLVIIILITRVVMKRRIAVPIRKISTAVESYAKGRQSGEQDKLYFQNLNVKTRDELEELSGVLSEMETDITVYEKNLVFATAERERFRTELSVATGIQAEMLPNTFPPYPDRSEFEIYASMNPAKEVGGDFYDFFLIDDDHFALVMADVSGKGIPAALFMMSAMIIVKNLASEGYQAHEVLEKANEQICKTNRLDMFVTVWFGILDLRSGVITAANAGHEYPIVRHAGGDYELMKDKHGFVVGGMEGVHYKEYSFTLESGSSLFLYTDGAPEATNANDELFGTDRLIAALNTAKDKNPEEVLRTVSTAVQAFVGEAPQFDDLTMMCVNFVHPSCSGQDCSDPIKA